MAITALPTDEISIRPLPVADVDFAARLHMTCLPDGFFVRLGRRFMQTYYRGFVQSDAGVALVAYSGDRPVGMAVGTSDHLAHRSYVGHSMLPRMALDGTLGLMTHPKAVRPFVRTRLRRYVKAILRLLHLRSAPQGTAPAGVVDLTDRRTGVLCHIAVDDSVRGRGVGTALLSEWVRRARDGGADVVKTCTAEDGGAVRFYVAHGWNITGTWNDSDGRPWVNLVLAQPS